MHNRSQTTHLSSIQLWIQYLDTILQPVYWCRSMIDQSKDIFIVGKYREWYFIRLVTTQDTSFFLCVSGTRKRIGYVCFITSNPTGWQLYTWYHTSSKQDSIWEWRQMIKESMSSTGSMHMLCKLASTNNSTWRDDIPSINHALQPHW